MAAPSQAVISSRPRPIRVVVAAIGAIVLAWGPYGCGPQPSKPPPHEDAMQAKVDPNLPLIELPQFDLAQPVASPQQNAAPQPLGQAIPASDFSIRVSAVRPDSDRSPPFPVVLRVLRRSATGELLTSASCFLKPVLQADNTVRYEGTCPQPAARGSSLLEITWQDKSYLVRAVEVQ